MLSYKDSVMAKGFDHMGKKCQKDYYKDEVIGMLSIEQVLMCLVHNNYGFKKNKPTKEELQRALREIKREHMNTFSDDFDFYAENIISKFLEVSK